MQMVGTDAIPDVTWSKRAGTRMLPVLPSDHYCLYLVMQPQDAFAHQQAHYARG